MEALLSPRLVGLSEHDDHGCASHLGAEHAVEVVDVCVLGSLGCDVAPSAKLDGRGVDVVADSFAHIQFDSVSRERFDVGISVARCDCISSEARPL